MDKAVVQSVFFTFSPPAYKDFLPVRKKKKAIRKTHSHKFILNLTLFEIERVLGVSVLAGGTAVFVFEALVKSIPIQEAALLDDTVYRVVAVFQKLAATLQTHVHNIVGKAHIERLFK